MSESISSSTERQSRLPSVTSLKSNEESTPLLATLPNDGFKSYDSVDADTKMAQSERLSTSALLWIMFSIRLGSFLSGLGEQCLRNTAVALTLNARDDS